MVGRKQKYVESVEGGPETVTINGVTGYNGAFEEPEEVTDSGIELHDSPDEVGEGRIPIPVIYEGSLMYQAAIDASDDSPELVTDGGKHEYPEIILDRLPEEQPPARYAGESRFEKPDETLAETVERELSQSSGPENVQAELKVDSRRDGLPGRSRI